MAITKRLRVSFDVKVVMPGDELDEFAAALVNLSGRFVRGEKLHGLEIELARVAAQDGPEAAFELALKAGIVQKLKEEMPEENATVSNFRVEVRQ